MKSTNDLGAVFQLNWDERPIRVIAFDDKVVMYDAWWSHKNAWGMAKLTGRFFYYRMNRDFFEAGARYLRTDTYTEEEHTVHRPDLPFAFAAHDSLSWYTQHPGSKAELERQLADARVPEQKHKAGPRLTTPAIYLEPYGPKGMGKPTTLIAAQDGDHSPKWRCCGTHGSCKPRISASGSSRRVSEYTDWGIQRRKPSYYIWGAKSKLELPL